MKNKVLVVDDQEPILEIIRYVLEDGGFDVKTVSQTKTIYETINNYSPDLIILDYWMPGLSGPEITKHLKSGASTKNIPVIILSALSNIKDKAEEIGADACLPKPFEIDDLVNLVKSFTTHPLLH